MTSPNFSTTINYGSKDLQAQVDQLVQRLKRRQLVSSWHIAVETTLLLRQIVSFSRWPTVKQLEENIRLVGKKLQLANPSELVIGNIIRRVLHLIREESYSLCHPSAATTKYVLAKRSRYAETSLMFSLFGASPTKVSPSASDDKSAQEDPEQEEDSTSYSLALKPIIIQSLQEYLDELENVYVNIATQSVDHIHSNEIVLTLGKSRTVEAFLKHASKKRQFQVVVAETAPSCSGHDQAAALCSTPNGMVITLISDAAVYAVMPRINKVILGSHTVLANGGLVAVAGSRLIAEAAKSFQIPVICCAGIFKLSPEVVFDEATMEPGHPVDQVLPFAEWEDSELVNPSNEYVPPELIDLFVTNVGVHPTSYLCRLLAEHYDAEDTVLN